MMQTFLFKRDQSRIDCLAGTSCPCCPDNLVVHQPDPEMPDRLLGTCEECKSWYLIDAESGVMALLPCEPRQDLTG
jgi:uncharacterized protein YbaR (Trm112 family)